MIGRFRRPHSTLAAGVAAMVVTAIVAADPVLAQSPFGFQPPVVNHTPTIQPPQTQQFQQQLNSNFQQQLQQQQFQQQQHAQTMRQWDQSRNQTQQMHDFRQRADMAAGHAATQRHLDQLDSARQMREQLDRSLGGGVGGIGGEELNPGVPDGEIRPLTPTERGQLRAALRRQRIAERKAAAKYQQQMQINGWLRMHRTGWGN